MKPEETKALMKRFPMLYRGYYKSMRETCMCWGFDVNSGWFSIIWMLSLALEEELKKIHPWYVRKFFRQLEWAAKKWNSVVWVVLKFIEMRRGKKTPVMEILNRKTFRSKLYVAIMRLLCHTQYFEVTQVKEKYGTLRFYTNWSTDEMERFISVACKASHNTCEICGHWGKCNSFGWIVCLCDTHRKEYNKDHGVLEDEDDDNSDEG